MKKFAKLFAPSAQELDALIENRMKIKDAIMNLSHETCQTLLLELSDTAAPAFIEATAKYTNL